MADIPGFKSIRLLAQQPMPMMQPFLTSTPTPKRYTMEVSFEDDSVINVPLTQELHDKLRDRMAAQIGVALAEHMAARGGVALEGEQKTQIRERALPLDASGQQIYEALLSVSGRDVPPVTNRDRVLQEGEEPDCPTFGCVGGKNAPHNEDCPNHPNNAHDVDDHD